MYIFCIGRRQAYQAMDMVIGNMQIYMVSPVKCSLSRTILVLEDLLDNVDCMLNFSVRVDDLYFLIFSYYHIISM